MALDATVAGPAANSYLTVAEADAIAATDPVNGETWGKATVQEREKNLQAATADVDLYRRAGIRFDATQALLFPRSVDVVDPDADPLVPFLLPDVLRATYEQAVYLHRNAHLIADAASHRAAGLLNAASDDGGSWTSAISPTFGLYAPKMAEYLDRIGSASRTGRFLVSVPIGSSFPP